MLKTKAITKRHLDASFSSDRVSLKVGLRDSSFINPPSNYWKLVVESSFSLTTGLPGL